MKNVTVNIDHIDENHYAATFVTVQEANRDDECFDLAVSLKSPTEYDLYDEDYVFDDDYLNKKYTAEFVAAVAKEIVKAINENLTEIVFEF